MGCVHEDYVINRLATALGLSFAKVGIEVSPQKGSVLSSFFWKKTHGNQGLLDASWIHLISEYNPTVRKKVMVIPCFSWRFFLYLLHILGRSIWEPLGFGWFCISLHKVWGGATGASDLHKDRSQWNFIFENPIGGPKCLWGEVEHDYHLRRGGRQCESSFSGDMNELKLIMEFLHAG